ncbi:Acid phosphatase/vanadium-dependent haloperoxidase-related protein [Rhynchospora pubera]|uniref:Acid phosphatase/vanadium-dependent haloperoxidase-related protein n=1 Tax=Rhynchospora pubera TaxID=906938 RepID=A0AAV8F9Q3_9POAL|nr:Acid phosphatase/vanadium-dependent haloperoxidase-related protein [Rhynchospora pubera]
MEILSLKPSFRVSSSPLPRKPNLNPNPRRPKSISTRPYSPSFSKLSSFPLKNPRFETLQHQSNAIPHLCFIFSLLQSLPKVQSFLHGGFSDPTIRPQFKCQAGIGTILMSTTAAAISKSRVSPFLWTLAANPTFVSGLVAWFLAQTIKVFLNFFVERKWDLGILFSSGGMPSSHSSLCTALTASVAFCHGVSDSLFPVCLGFSLIVMYDATGVRRHAGMQAEVLNKIVEDLFQGHPISERKLKELLGHTPSQVFAGAVLGILVAWFCCQGCIVPI